MKKIPRDARGGVPPDPSAAVLPGGYLRDCLLGAAPFTWDFVLSQGSGNAALLLWVLANAAWAARRAPGKEAG